MKKLTAGIFFTMAGSWAVALKELGIKMDWHFMDSKKFHGTDFHKVFSLNFPDVPISDNWSDIATPVDIIVGSPPCVGISAANKQSGLNHPENQRLTEFAITVEAFQPKGFMMEMTPGFPKPRFAPLFKEYTDILSRSYNFKWEIVNFVDYGTPAVRKRFIIMGIRKDINKKIIFPKPFSKQTTIKEAFIGLPKLTAKQAVEQDMGWKFNPKWKGSWRTYIKRPGHFQLQWDGVAPCVTALDTVYFKHPDFKNERYKRTVTYREAARLQEFPDDFEFTGTYGKKVRQISWGVPCKGIQPFIKEIMKWI